MQNSSSFRHLILTRFNCRFADKDFPARTQRGWLDERFALFEKYCLPTMIAQTNQAFDWLIYFDAETPQPYVDRALGLLTRRPNFHVRFLDVYTGENLRCDIKLVLDGGCAWLLSTRLDNDDGLNVSFVEHLQQATSVGLREALNFPLGLILSAGRTYASRQSSNAFLSVSEPYDGFGTALFAPHKSMSDFMPVRDIAADPMWLQVIHDSNVSNKRRGRRMLRRDVLPGFEPIAEFSGSPPAESGLAVALENMTFAVAWAGRDAAAQLARRAKRLSRR